MRQQQVTNSELPNHYAWCNAPVMKHKHPNNLLNLMERDGVSQADIARAWGVENGDASQRVNQKVRVTQERALVLQRVFGWTPSEIYGVGELARLVPVIGEVGAGGKVYSIDDLPLMPNGLQEGEADFSNCDTVECPPGVYPSEVGCVVVRGDSMYPRYKDGEYLFYRQRQQPIEDFIGEDCILELESGQHLVKVLRRAQDEYGVFNLESYNPEEKVIRNAKIKWATPVVWSKKRSARK